MARITITAEDFMAIELLPDGWYPFEITFYEDKLSTEGDSTNHWLHYKVNAGKYASKVIKQSYNEKFIGPIIPVFQAAGANLQKGKSQGVNPEQLVTKRVDAYVETGKSDKGTKYNKLTDFAPYGTRSKKVLEEQAAAEAPAKA